MICGIGVDLVSVQRVQELIIRSSSGVLQRMFTEAELECSKMRGIGKAEYLATRFAAKEAVTKALAPRAKYPGFDLRRVETLNRPDGAPYVNVNEYLQEVMDAAGAKSLHISITTEEGYACAFVVAES